MRNMYKVPVKQWNRWTEPAKRVFNECFRMFLNNQVVLTHPEALKIKREHWKTVAWNAAWTAADACDDVMIQRGDTVKDVRGRKVVREHRVH